MIDLVNEDLFNCVKDQNNNDENAQDCIIIGEMFRDAQKGLQQENEIEQEMGRIYLLQDLRNMIINKESYRADQF